VIMLHAVVSKATGDWP